MIGVDIFENTYVSAAVEHSFLQSTVSTLSLDSAALDSLHMNDLSLAPNAGFGLLVAGNKKNGMICTLDLQTKIISRLAIEVFLSTQ